MVAQSKQRFHELRQENFRRIDRMSFWLLLGQWHTLLSKAQYDAMPLRDRVKLILQSEVTFYDHEDKVVPATQALMRQKT